MFANGPLAGAVFDAPPAGVASGSAATSSTFVSPQSGTGTNMFSPFHAPNFSGLPRPAYVPIASMQVESLFGAQTTPQAVAGPSEPVRDGPHLPANAQHPIQKAQGLDRAPIQVYTPGWKSQASWNAQGKGMGKGYDSFRGRDTGKGAQGRGGRPRSYPQDHASNAYSRGEADRVLCVQDTKTPTANLVKEAQLPEPDGTNTREQAEQSTARNDGPGSGSGIASNNRRRKGKGKASDGNIIPNAPSGPSSPPTGQPCPPRAVPATGQAPTSTPTGPRHTPITRPHNNANIVRLVHGHPALANARTDAYALACSHWMSCMPAVGPLPNAPPTVFMDIGGGRSGINYALKFFDEHKAMLLERGVVLHVLFPIESLMDVARRDVITKYQGKLNITTRGFVTDKVNYCHHKLHECDCLHAYGRLYPIAVHSMYYLMEQDYARLYAHANNHSQGDCEIWAAIHKPNGDVLPQDAPEFAWVNADTNPEVYSYTERATSMVRNLLQGEPLVKFIPLGPAGTTYTHDAMNWLASGGKHVTPFTLFLDTMTHSLKFCFLVLLALGALCCCWFVHAYYHARFLMAWSHHQYQWHMSTTPWPFRDAFYGFTGWWHGYHMGWMQMFSPVWLALLMMGCILTVLYHTLPSAHPKWGTWFTISIAHVTSIADSAGHPVSEVVKVRVGVPATLVSQVWSDVVVEPEAFVTAVASLLLAKASDESNRRVVANTMRRLNGGSKPTSRAVQLAAARVATITSTMSGNGSGMIGSRIPNRFQMAYSYLLFVLRVFLLPVTWPLGLVFGSQVIQLALVLTCLYGAVQHWSG